MSLFTININATNDTIPKVPPDSLQLTYKQVYTDIKSGISAIADGLKVGSEHVYGVLVKQQVSMAIVHTTLLIPIIILSIICFNSFKKSRWKDSASYYGHPKDEHYNKYASLTIVSGILLLFSIIAFLTNMDSIITGFINPEYGAIHEILTHIK